MRRLAVCCIFAVSAFAAEYRFGRPVLKVADPTAYRFLKLDGNQYPYLETDGISTSCIVYRGTVFYYVEVSITNNRSEPLVLSPDFLTFTKPGATVALADTLLAAGAIDANASAAVVPAPAPQVSNSKTTVYSGTATTTGNVTQINGTATTTDANAGCNSIGQALDSNRYNAMQAAAQADRQFAVYLASRAHERLSLIIEPGKASVFMFAFQQAKPHKAPFTVQVQAGSNQFSFAYKD